MWRLRMEEHHNGVAQKPEDAQGDSSKRKPQQAGEAGLRGAAGEVETERS